VSSGCRTQGAVVAPVGDGVNDAMHVRKRGLLNQLIAGAAMALPLVVVSGAHGSGHAL